MRVQGGIHKKRGWGGGLEGVHMATKNLDAWNNTNHGIITRWWWV
jgi:hypothetical protein